MARRDTVSTTIGCSRPAVWRWQQRFAEAGVDGLLRDKTRKPGKPPTAEAVVRRVVALTCGEPPGGATHWTGRMNGRGHRSVLADGAADLDRAPAAAAPPADLQAQP